GYTTHALESGTYDVVKLNGAQINGSPYYYGLANAEGKVIAVSADGLTWSVLEAAVDPDLDAAAIANDGQSTGSGLQFSFNEAVTSGSVEIEVSGNNATIKGTATLTLAENAGLAAGKYTVVDNSGTLELHNEAGEKVAEWDGT